MKKQEAYATPTSELMWQYERATNPVKRWSLREIIGDRIDRHERRRLQDSSQPTKEA